MSSTTINPSRLRKTAKAASHNQATSAATINPDLLPKGRRARDKVLFEHARTAAAVGNPIQSNKIDAPSLMLYAVLSAVFWGSAIGWWFGVPIFETIVVAPISFVFRVVSFPIRFPLRVIWKLFVSGGGEQLLPEKVSRIAVPVVTQALEDDF
ncbi:hypothetical protein HDU81_008014 [Chytriomyces hyalinus]|nr:hypothetical protein HDU81_008014 [Chytriomyces hyalinus]